MKEPQKIPLTNNPKNKEPKKIPLTTPNYFNIEMADDLWIKNEDNKQNDTQSVQKLETEQIN